MRSRNSRVSTGVACLLVGVVLFSGAVRAEDATAKIDNFTFVPARLIVKAGTTVTWRNEDDIPHTIASAARLFKSKALDTNDSFSFTFTEPRHLRIFLLPAPTHDRDDRGRAGKGALTRSCCGGATSPLLSAHTLKIKRLLARYQAGRSHSTGRYELAVMAYSGFGGTGSAMSAGRRSYWPSAQRYSIATLRPSA